MTLVTVVDRQRLYRLITVRTARECPAMAQRATSGPYYLLAPENGSELPPRPGLGVAVPGRPAVRVVGGEIRLRLSDGIQEARIRSCTSSEGVHLTVWSGVPLRTRRLWHAYWYLGYDVEPDCRPADYQEGGGRVGVSLGMAVTPRDQAASPPVLPAPLRAHFKDERFGIVTSVRGLPLGVREALQTLFGSPSLDIAEPGAAFQVTDVIVNPKLPIRRLVAAGCSTDHCLVYYERGGYAHTWHATLFHWTPAETRFEWGGTAPGGLAAIGDVRNAALAGEIKSPGRVW